jgi:hypothetical protein
VKTQRVALILDKSGSMACVVEPTVSTYNEQVQQLQINAREGQTILASLLTFNSNVYEHHWDVPAERLELASREGYVPEGGTNILDAIGHAVDRWTRESDPADPDNAYLLNVITDGAHNVNGKWDARRLHGCLKELQDTGRWTVAFMGCDRHVLERLAGDLGVPQSNMAIWSNASAAVAQATATAGNIRAMDRYLKRSGGPGGQSCGAANFYNATGASLVDYTAAAAPWQHVNSRRRGTVLMGFSDEEPTSGDVALAAAADPASVATTAEPPRYVFGVANVFGTCNKVS